VIGSKATFYLETNTRTQDAIGSSTVAREIVRKFRGHITTVYGKENILYNKETTKATHIIHCDYFTPITEDYQIRMGSRIFDIKYVYNIDELSKALRIYVEERR